MKNTIKRVSDFIITNESASYYKTQLNRINLDSVYAPKIKIRGGVDGETNYIDINKESAQALVDWLTVNFLK